MDEDQLDDLLAVDALAGEDIDRLVESIPIAPATEQKPNNPHAERHIAKRKGNATREEKAKPPGEAAGIGFGNVTRQTVGRRIFYDLKNVPNAIRLISPLPKPGEIIHAIMGGDFACWDLCPAILEQVGKPARRLVIATLGFNERNNWHLCRLIDQGQIGTAWVLASDFFAKSDAAMFKEAREALARRGSHLTSTRNHAKVIALDFEDAAFVVEGSANMRSCNNLEQFTLTNDRDVYRFHERWITSIP